MASIRGKIINPVTVGGIIINEIETPVNVVVGTNMKYDASSLSTYIESGNSFFLPLNLTNVDNIFLIPKPEKYHKISQKPKYESVKMYERFWSEGR